MQVRRVVWEGTGYLLQLHPREMLLFDLDRSCGSKGLVAYMLSAASFLLAQKWKSQELSSTAQWLIKVRHMSLLNKLSAVSRFRVGNLIALKRYNEQ